ncbi:unnamed protein product [Durusdinium trenchii]|uniref:Uncharacterized protein n=2 Tax=Durusdinium trenchii TaxID=1381693 RepID=A0ABP0RKZ3_9DINO
MPGRWTYATQARDVEDLVPDTIEVSSGQSFDGFWEATMADGDSTCSTVVVLSGQNVWHEGSRFASIKVLNSHTCVLIMDEDDVRGYLSADGHEIEWEDGDRWRRARKITKDTDEIQKPVSISETNMQECVSPEALIKEHRSTDHTTSSEQSQLAVDSLLQRDALSLQRLLNNGMCADTCIDPSPLWTDIGWTPEGDSQRTPTPLLVAAILLQWPEGVRICVDRKANVNGTYAGPFRSFDGCTLQEKSGASILRVALSARGPSQCTICQHVLAGRVRGRTFQTLKRKAKDEMEFVTRGLFETFQGPFADS